MKACCALKKMQGRKLDASGWLVSGGLLLLVPKCPMCLAAYVAAFTGLGLPLTAAAGLRWAMIALCFVIPTKHLVPEILKISITDFWFL